MPVLGGGGGASFFGQTLTATASGAIADGDPVILNADGTVSAVDPEAYTGPGLKMFVVGATGDSVYEYALSSYYNVPSATYTQSFSVSAEETSPQGVAFNNDGTKMYIVGTSGDDVNEYDLSTAWDISTAVYSQSFSVSAQETSPNDIVFSTDGTKMFIVGATGDDVNEYDLSVAFDISTASYNSLLSVSSADTSPQAIAFRDDGKQLFVLGSQNDSIYRYSIPTAFDISSSNGVVQQTLNISSYETAPTGLAFNPEGTQIYVLGSNGRDVTILSLSTPWNIGTVVSVNTFSVNAQDTSPNGIAFGGGPVSNLSQGRYIGIADGAYADGATATIQLAGAVDDAQTGLTAGKTYYVQQDGSLAVTPDVPEVEAGYAISATELLVKGAYSSVTSEGAYTPPPMSFNLSGLSRGQRLMFTSSTVLVPNEDITVLVTCVGGGAAGDTSTTAAGLDAGGAGGLCQSMLTLTAGGEYTLTVGAGGKTGSGGTTSFSGTGVTTMTASGGGRPTGGSASGGNIVNNKGGDGNTDSYGGGGAIGVLRDGQGGTGGGSGVGGSIDFLPDIFPIYTSSGGQKGSSTGGYYTPGPTRSFGGATFTGYSSAGCNGGTGSGGGGAFGSRGGAGGAGGFPGGGGGSVYATSFTGYVDQDGDGGDGCIVIEVI